jgi:sugar phosphate isomerase/epimerase
MNREVTRREFLAQAAGGVAALSAARAESAQSRPADEPLFRISLAQWSLHRAIKGGLLNPLDFPQLASRGYGFDAVEYVNQFFMDKAGDAAWLTELKRRADDHGVRSLLIMCDGEGALGDADSARRASAIDHHHKWVEAAKFLGCHSIRVNAESSGKPDEQHKLAVDGLSRLTEFAARHEINVLVENHGGASSNGAWLAGVIKAVNHPRCGTLPDFGNFLLGRLPDGAEQWYDRYQGVRELMPYAKAVSAKSHDFDDQGNESRTDYRKMLRIVTESGYRGFIGVEYEGERLSEKAGIRATKRLLEAVRAEMSESRQ